MHITIEVPDDLAETLWRTPEELRDGLRLQDLAGLVERGLLSRGRAAERAGGAPVVDLPRECGPRA
jgi:hypothetical protein